MVDLRRGGFMNAELAYKNMEFELGRLHRTRQKKEIEIEDRKAEIENMEYRSQLELDQIDQQISDYKDKMKEFSDENKLNQEDGE